MNPHLFLRLLRWPRPLLTVVAAIFAIIISLQGDVLFNKVKPVSALTSPVSQQQDGCLATQSITGSDLLRQGQACYQAGRFANAEAVWANAEQNFASQGDSLNQAVALSNRALAYRQLGYIENGVNAAEASVALVKSIGSLTTQGFRIYGQTFNTQGSLYLAQGQTKEAWQAWKDATTQYKKAGYTEGIFKSLLNQAQAARSLGFFLQSSELISEAENILENSDDPALAVELTLSLGETQRLLGSLEDSQITFQKALDQAQDENLSDELTARISLSQGNVAQALAREKAISAERTKQETDQALEEELYQPVLKIYQAILNTDVPSIIKIRSQLNQLAIFIELEQWDKVLTLSTSLPNAIDKLPSSRLSGFSRLTLSRLLLDVIDPCAQNTPCQVPINLQRTSKQIVYDLLSTIRKQATPNIDPIVQSYALGYLGHLYELDGNTIDAQRLTRKALTLTDRSNIIYQWYWQLGRLTTDSRETSLKYYKAAFENVKTVRDDLVYISPDVQFNFRDRIEPLYRQYISLLLPEDGTNIKADLKELRQAQTVIDDLRVAELQSLLACGLLQPDDDIPRVDIQDIAGTNKKNTGIIYPIILPDGSESDRLEVLIQLPDKPIKRYPSRRIVSGTSTVDGSDKLSPIEQNLKKFREELEQPYFSSKRGKPLAADFYDWLIRPAEEQDLSVDSIDTLVFVLDGAFRNIPMAALYDRQNNQFLIEKYAVTVTVGDLELPVKPPKDSFKVLAAGLSESPKFTTESNVLSDSFGPLFYVKSEIQAIKDNIQNTVSFLDQKFTQKAVQKTMSSADYNIVHLATHGEFGVSRDKTFLLAAAPDSGDSTDKTIEVEKINLNRFNTLLKTRNQIPIELLVLSACETATGDNREVLGIAGLSVQSGARSTLATLWSINDSSTALLMETFYKNLVTQKGAKAKALQKAQVQLLKQGYKPSIWAPYLLVGDWR